MEEVLTFQTDELTKSKTKLARTTAKLKTFEGRSESLQALRRELNESTFSERKLTRAKDRYVCSLYIRFS